jgi:hypothetical protein
VAFCVLMYALQLYDFWKVNLLLRYWTSWSTEFLHSRSAITKLETYTHTHTHTHTHTVCILYFYFPKQSQIFTFPLQLGFILKWPVWNLVVAEDTLTHCDHLPCHRRISERSPALCCRLKDDIWFVARFSTTSLCKSHDSFCHHQCIYHFPAHTSLSTADCLQDV